MENNRFNKVEKFFFLLIVGLNLIPILSGPFFPTLDGPAHLYNSQVINTLIFDAQTPLKEFFVLNPEPVPNWTGHFLLSLFNLFLPAFLAEKIVLLFYVIGLPLAFRALVKTISPNTHYLMSYLIFPFVYSFVFFLGFYNFSIALVFMLLTLNYWLKTEDQLPSIKNVLVLFLLISLTYFSHIFVFAILLFVIGLQILFKAIIRRMNQTETLKETCLHTLQKVSFLSLSASIPLLLFIQYFITRPSLDEDTFKTNADLIDSLQNISSIIAYNATQEEPYTKLIYKVLIALFLIALFNGIRRLTLRSNIFNRRQLLNNMRTAISASTFWIFGIVVLLILYFKLPDSDGSAGFVSVRLGLLFFIFILIWLSTQRFPKWIGLVFTGVLLYSNYKLNAYYTPIIERLNEVAMDCHEIAEQIPSNSVVLPLDFSNNWMSAHYSNYLGIDKPLILLENYECATGYFPVNWNQKEMPNTLFGDLKWNDIPCIEWHSNTGNQKRIIEYIFVLGDLKSKKDACNDNLKKNLKLHYTQTFQNQSATLYQLKTN